MLTRSYLPTFLSLRTFYNSSFYYADPKPSDKKLEKKTGGKKTVEKTSEGSVYGTGRSRELDLSIAPNKVVSKLISKSELKKKFKKDKLKLERINKMNKSNLAAAMKKETNAKTEDTKTEKIKKGLNLYQLCLSLPNDGVGLRVYRDMMARYDEPSYWNIVKVTKPTISTKCRIFGVLTWRGETKLGLVRIPKVAKKEWHCLEIADDKLSEKRHVEKREETEDVIAAKNLEINKVIL